MTPEVRRLERLAERLRSVDPVVPPPGAKIRGWNLALAAVEQSAMSRSRRKPVRRALVAAFAAAVLVLAGAVAAAADSLPDSPLYPLKGAVEQVRGALTFSPADRVAFHLDLARTRLSEAEAMIARQRLDLAGQALATMSDELNSAARVVQAEKQTDPTSAAGLEDRLRQAIAVHDQQLTGLQGQVTNPAALRAISEARDRATEALQLAGSPDSGSHATPNPGGNGKGKTPAGNPARPTATP